MTYFPRYNGNTNSIYDALSAVGADGSLANRKIIAAATGISNYTGTAAQNTQMLNLLKSGNLVNPSGSNDGRTTTTYVISDDGTITETTVPADGNGTAPVDVTKPGMNKWLKYGLIAGGVAVAGLLIYKLTKRKKKVEQRPTKRGKGMSGTGHVTMGNKNDGYSITLNHKNKTYTICRREKGKLISKYRTYPQGRDFSTTWTENDIKNYLRYNDGDYYRIK